jgi:two-component system heavy metal sensor histidine kinase CusS
VTEAIKARTRIASTVLPMHAPTRSLRLQLTLWSFLLTFGSLALCGCLLYAYLSYALSSSRSDSMLKRDQRLVRFLRADEDAASVRDTRTAMQHFLEATPETDLVKILDAGSSELLYASSDSLQWLQGSVDPCLQPCLSTVIWKGHRFRVLTHTTELHGRATRLILAGSIDEHFDILRKIGVGFLGLIPLTMVGAIVAGHWLSRRALIPVGRMTSQVRCLGPADLRSRIDVPQTKDELQELALAWNDMLARLETSADRISQFAADASHDLRTALTILLANAELTLRQDRSAQRYQDSLRTIVSESVRMLEMIDGLLLTANSGWGQEELKIVSIDIGELLTEVFEAHHASATMRHQTFRLLNSHCSPMLVAADRSLLARLLNILVDNSVKYTPDGGSIVLGLTLRGQQAHIEVIDNGVGIPAEMQERIFERLVRIAPERTHSAEGGYGLGLSIARWIAERHGFSLEVVSAPQQGSTFRVVLPLVDSENALLRAV